MSVKSFKIPFDNYTHKDVSSLASAFPEEKEFLVHFLNTTIFFRRSKDYSDIDGEYEFVDSEQHLYLASSKCDFAYKNGSPLKEDPVNIEERISSYPPVEARNVILGIPIYGSTYYSRCIVNNLRDIERELYDIGCKVVVSIDFQNEEMTKKHLKIFSEEFLVPLEVKVQKENVGFVRNCNSMFEECQDGFFILWTSDVKVPSGGVNRLLKPLCELDAVALSTPYAYGGENLEAPENIFQNWRDFDRALSMIEPTYPDAETNVGYLLGIDNSKLQMEKLFDEFIDNGYGDDSDLYYRSINKGYRGVVVDNLCVYHEHGASFSHTGDREVYQRNNFAAFMRKWGNALDSRLSEKSFLITQNKEEIQKISRLYWQLNVESVYVTFVLPTNDRRIGGVKAVFDLCEKLCELGTPARVIVFSKPYQRFHQHECECIHVEDKSLLGATLDKTKFLVATSSDTVSFVKKAANERALKTAYFVQGPEFSFSEGRALREVVKGYSGFDYIWAVSEYLKEIIEPWCDKAPIVVPYGPAEDRYYDMGFRREEKSVAVQFNGRLDKGADYIAAMIVALKPYGYKFYSFGDAEKSNSVSNFCTNLGFLDYKGKIDLFNKVEFYLDASHYEGLGLLLMESVRCGAVPIYRSNGGSSKLLKDCNAGCLIGDYGDILSSVNKIEEMRSSYDSLKKQSWIAHNAFEGHYVEVAAKKIVEVVYE
ncbi:glycosyltransferase [Halomonas elongata]|uniref:glycosyltransferase n=1 Tax=Halomonas elongata TaxID=2746 RepID=UPI0023B0784F|nr:glycosyltransferase [Halomonas elongata]